MADVSALQGLLDRPTHERDAAGYAHTAKEMASQPAAWRKTAKLACDAMQMLRSCARGSSRILLTGAGSSYYTALAVATFLRASFPGPEAIPSTEIVVDPESSFPREEFLLISFARSGDSPEGNAAVSLAEELRPGRVRHLAITCNPSGGLARMMGRLGGATLLLPEETNDQGLAMTSSMTSMIVAGYALGHLEEPARYLATVDALAEAATRLLHEGSNTAATLAHGHVRRAFFIASRPFVAGAHEAHLKVQELTGGRIIAKAEDTLGFRHGFMAAVDSDSLIVLHLSGSPYRRRYELDLLAELRAKGLGRTTLIVSGGAPAELAGDMGRSASLLDYGLGEGITDGVRAPLVVLPGQLLGLFCSLALGYRPDTPSPSGVINRVVQGVRIHPYGP